MGSSEDTALCGLTSAEVEQRIAEGKINGDQTIRTKSYFQIIFTNIFTFFNVLLITLGIILSAFVDLSTADGLGNFGFVILILINTSAGIFQEARAKHTIDKLSLISAPKVTVMRGGEKKEIKIKDVVLDDVTLHSAGGQICADAVVVDGSVEVNESLITGEPDAILKNPGDEIISGSFVVSGRAAAKVIHVGTDNFATKISMGAKYFKKPDSEIMRALMFVVKIMAFIIVPIGIALFCSKYFRPNEGINDTVVHTIGTLVAMIPSGLVMLATIVFCLSVIRLTRHKTLAQNMYCIETLARVDVLCLDKTGTITEGSMEVNSIQPCDGDDAGMKQTLRNLTAALNEDNSTANAIKLFVADFSVSQQEIEDVVPFSSSRKWSGARFCGKSYVLGAPEFVFKNTDVYIKSETDIMAEKGFRVLVLAVSENPFDGQELPIGLTLEGFIYITDKIRAEAPDTLEYFRKQGVTVKIISGDNPATVRAVAMRAGLSDYDNYIDMTTIQTDDELKAAAEQYSIFGRVLPDQKLKLVKTLKANGHTVAMTGDGVNDVLALKESDCSIAMASGSDAAKNVSSLILMDSNFASMPKVVAEGRRSINNLERSASLFLVKTMYSLMFAIIFMIVASDLPFAPKQLTLIGGVTIGIPSFLLALEPNSRRVEGRFLPKVLASALPGAITVVLGVIAVIICDKYIMDLSVGQTRNMYFIITTFVGFMYLFRVSLPLNLWHIALWLLLIGAFISCYFVVLPFFDLQSFFGISYDVTWEMGKALLVIFTVLIVIFLTLSIGMRKSSVKFEQSANKLKIKLAPIRDTLAEKVTDPIKKLFTKK